MELLTSTIDCPWADVKKLICGTRRRRFCCTYTTDTSLPREPSAGQTFCAIGLYRPTNNLDLIHDSLYAFNSAHGFLRQLGMEEAV
jgi:hypothetical protein